MAEIRQVSRLNWNEIIRSKGSLQAQDNFRRSVEDWRADWAKRAQALAAQKKAGKISAEVFAAQDAVLNTERDNYLLGVGFYETVTDEILNTRFHDTIIDAVKEKPVLVLRIVTSITNYYRGQRGKAELTEAQVKSRLLA